MTDERIAEQIALVCALKDAAADETLTDLQKAKAASLLEKEEADLDVMFQIHEGMRCPTTRS